MSMTRSKRSRPLIARQGARRAGAGVAEPRGRVPVQRVVDQRGLARAGNAGHAASAAPPGSSTSRSRRLLPLAPGSRCGARRRPRAWRGTAIGLEPGEVLAGERIRVGVDLRRRGRWRRPRRRGRRRRARGRRRSRRCGSPPRRARRRSRCCRGRAGAASVPSSRALSRWCRPIEGSSRMYMTPVSPEPTWLARRMRCVSPPEKRVGGAIERSGIRGRRRRGSAAARRSPARCAWRRLARQPGSCSALEVRSSARPTVRRVTSAMPRRRPAPRARRRSGACRRNRRRVAQPR